MRFAAARSILRIVDGIDGACLCVAGGRRHGEIGIAARLQEDRQLLVDTAQQAIGPRVAESPVAVDEAILDLAGAVVAA